MASLLLWPAVALAFCTSIVSLGGLAALQDDCTDKPLRNAAAQLANGFSGGDTLLCKRIYEFFWFVVIFEVLLVLAIAGVAATDGLRTLRLSLLSLLTVATVLYINMTDSFNTARELPFWGAGDRKDKTLTMLAGCLMTAVANAFLMVAMGVEDVPVDSPLPPMARV